MNLLDIIGPVMVGPSSSHTAGAVKIGRVCHKLLAEKVVRADIFFHGSFLATGKGHGTDKAVVAGLLGMQVDDPAIPHSFEIAEREGLQFTLSGIDLGDVHPNSVKLELTGESGRTLEVIAASIGGGRIEICEIDGLTANFSGDYPTLIVHNIDIHACPQIGQHRNDAVIPCKPWWKCSYGHRVRSGNSGGCTQVVRTDGRNFESNLSEFTVNKFFVFAKLRFML